MIELTHISRFESVDAAGHAEWGWGRSGSTPQPAMVRCYGQHGPDAQRASQTAMSDKSFYLMLTGIISFGTMLAVIVLLESIATSLQVLAGLK